MFTEVLYSIRPISSIATWNSLSISFIIYHFILELELVCIMSHECRLVINLNWILFSMPALLLLLGFLNLIVAALSQICLLILLVPREAIFISVLLMLYNFILIGFQIVCLLFELWSFLVYCRELPKTSWVYLILWILLIVLQAVEVVGSHSSLHLLVSN